MLIGRLGRIGYQRVRNFIFLSKKCLALVFLQPTCCFDESDVSFCEKQRVVFGKITCRFEENSVLFCLNE